MLTQQQLRKVFRPLNHLLIPADDTAVMSTTLRPPASSCLHPDRPTVEEVVARIADLVLARQSLRAGGADELILEENRRELVKAHWDLSRALIERHCPPKADVQPAAA